MSLLMVVNVCVQQVETFSVGKFANAKTYNICYRDVVSFLFYIDCRERKTRGHERGHYVAIE